MYILGIPVLIVLLLGITLLLLLAGRWKTALVLFILTLALNKSTQTFPVNPFYAWSWNEDAASDSVTLNVMTYNVGTNGDEALEAYLDSQKVDLLCLQESFAMGKKNSLHKRFPYHEGTSLFSKYPIKNCHRLTLDKESPEWEAMVDSVCNPDNYHQPNLQLFSMQIEHPAGTINLITCHLRSNSYSVARRNMDKKSRWTDGLNDYYHRIVYGYKVRKIESDLIRQELDSLPDAPTLVLGDFNDLSGSYALKTIQGDRLMNAWWEGGLGPGFTYDGFHLLLRLDHILYSPEFQLEQVFVDSSVAHSDHYPLRARFTLNF